MTEKFPVYQVDAFTREKLTGNPAGVVLDADRLSEGQMQAIARELNNSETAFVLKPDADDHDVRIRFFTPSVEVPSCGHATIAVHYVLAVRRQPNASLTVRQKIGIGVLPVEIVKHDSDYRIFMRQGRVEFSDFIEGAFRHTLLTALGIRATDLIENAPIQIVSTGHSKVLVGVKSHTILNELQPNLVVLKELSSRIGSNGYFIFTLDSDNPDILSHARMFAPAIGIHEDPVTGNGNGPLGAYLVRYGLVKHDGRTMQFQSKQGEAMGREGVAHVRVDIRDGQPTAVCVGGDATIVFQSTIRL